MKHTGKIGNLGLATILAQSMAFTGMSFAEFVDASNPHLPENRTETPEERAKRRAEETIITAQNKHIFVKYIKAEEKRERKAAKRIKEKNHDK